MKLIKLNRNTLTLIDTIQLIMSNSMSFTISDYLDLIYLSRKDSQTLSFTIEPVQAQVPYIKNESFVLVVREKVDLSATQPYDQTLAFEDKDTGKHDYINSYPYQPRNIIQGFTELKGE